MKTCCSYDKATNFYLRTLTELKLDWTFSKEITLKGIY